MAETFTRKDMDMAANRLAVEAMACGLLERDETLYYTNGSTGVAATLEIKKVIYDEWTFRPASWIPKFSPKDNKRTQYKMVYAAADALRATSKVIADLKSDISELKSEISGLTDN